MKKETINKIVNFIVTVLTAALSTFFMQSCMMR
ncbi:MAG: smalltalk protein [Paludibacteraceae bacterium]|nr:smalltalk protein [Prevotella sp.]MBQ8153507.1 smalltalk protein [Prevotella sp.]MBQ8705838.1 smalltalk protein [Paludibacteraceae bacterium]MBQ8715666.1 smalltalk protein [Prevotella sp.]